MRRMAWSGRLLAILGVAVLSAAVAAALPDNPYQRWQLVENTLYANATWSYERIHFDPRPIDVAIIGSSRTQLGLSAPRVARDLAAAGQPLAVANLSVIEDGRNIQWAVANELFKAKRPRVMVMVVGATFHPWGHPGFKYVAPAAALAAPPVPLLHNYFKDLIYLPYRQLELAAAAVAPSLSGLRAGFDPVRYAAKPVDYSEPQTLADGKRLDMYKTMTADALRAEAHKFAGEHHASRTPKVVTRVTDIDEQVYSDAIARLARAHGVPMIFVYMPEFEGAAAIEGQAFYAARGRIVSLADLSHAAALYQSFAHLNHRGAMIASDRVAAVVAETLGGTGATRDNAAGHGGSV